MQKLPVTDADFSEFSRMVRGIKFLAAMNMALLEKVLAGVSLYE